LESHNQQLRLVDLLRLLEHYAFWHLERTRRDVCTV
jgi:hypothetical protein